MAEGGHPDLKNASERRSDSPSFVSANDRNSGNTRNYTSTQNKGQRSGVKTATKTTMRGPPKRRGPAFVGIQMPTVLDGINIDASQILADMTVVDGAAESEPVAPTTEEDNGDLPVCQYKDEILEMIDNYRVVCIQGETGCGKSSMIPQFIIERAEENNGESVNILVTQPRRMAAVSLARRVALNLGEREPGNTVGYKIGGDYLTSTQTKVTYVTIGYLIQALVNNPSSFDNITHLVLDEIHERQIDCDLLSLLVKIMLREYESTKVIVMSATLQAQLFSDYYGQVAEVAPTTLFVGAKRFPITHVYLEDLINSQKKYLGMLTTEDINAVAKAWLTFNTSVFQKLKAEDEEDEDISEYLHEFLSKFSVSYDSRSNRMLNKIVQRLEALDIPADQLKPDVPFDLDKVCYSLISYLATPGESILVFLPGIADIMAFYDILAPLENPRRNTCPIVIYALHSQIAHEEQEACFHPPPPNRAHVILATNIAESSLTLPKVRVVIDFGLKRQIMYDERRHMMCLVRSWCSKASSRQRAGRTGRVFEGTVIHMYSELYFDKCMDEFDPPEIVTHPLDKVVLQVKQMGRKIAPSFSVTEILEEAVEPPPISKLKAAVNSLASVGALTDASEKADITLLGHIAMRLPLDMQLCRLILYGVLFGNVCDGVVMAAGISLRMDPFSQPINMAQYFKKNEDFVNSLRRSFTSRVMHDEGAYSEPLMLVNLFKSYLLDSHLACTKNTTWREGNQLFRRFCHHNAVSHHRLIEMEHSVKDIASRLFRCLSREGKARKSLTKLMKILKIEPESYNLNEFNAEKKSSSLGGIRINSIKNQEDAVALINELFSTDRTLLKILHLASFSPTFLKAKSSSFSSLQEIGKTKSKLLNRGDRLLKSISEEGKYDPKRTVVLRDIPSNLLRRGVLPIKDFVACIIGKEDKANFRVVGDNSIMIEFELDKVLDQHRVVSSVSDIPLAAHLVNQYGGGRFRFQVVLPVDPKKQKQKQEQRESDSQPDRIQLTQPKQPYLLCWELLNDQVTKSTGIINGWRNPIGFMCETEGIEHYAVASNVQGTSNPKTCRVDGLTVLPTQSNGLLAILLIILFLPHTCSVEFLVNKKARKGRMINGIKFMNNQIHLPKDNGIRISMLILANRIRKMISTTFVDPALDFLIPDTKLDLMISFLVDLVIKGGVPSDDIRTSSFMDADDDVDDATSDDMIYEFLKHLAKELKRKQELWLCALTGAITNGNKVDSLLSELKKMYLPASQNNSETSDSGHFLSPFIVDKLAAYMSLDVDAIKSELQDEFEKFQKISKMK